MIKLLIVDDSPTQIALLTTIFSAEKDFTIVGFAKNGEEAIKQIQLIKPDIITMDILMPVMNGLEATRVIMSQFPIPIVIISSTVNDGSKSITFEALDAGALAVLSKPTFVNNENFIKDRKKIVDMVRSMSEICVIKRRFFTKKPNTKLIQQPTLMVKKTIYEIIAIGSSVGGPQALKTIFSALPANFTVPIVVVQHMTRGFINGFASWLNNNTELEVKCAEDHEILQPGIIYFAPDANHTEIRRERGKLSIKLNAGPPISGFCPSATVLFQSVAKVCGSSAIGIILTGMGNDGAQGLLELKNVKGHTLIQDPDSAVVFGMAGVAQSLGAVDKVIELNSIASYLVGEVLPRT
jgi:two-component system chemotaxis response regulator CheB